MYSILTYYTVVPNKHDINRIGVPISGASIKEEFTSISQSLYAQLPCGSVCSISLRPAFQASPFCFLW